MDHPVPAGETSDKENFANRKLIRPTLPRVENHGNHTPAPMPVQDRRERPERHERGDRGDRGDRPMGASGRKPAPPEQTNAENFYYQKQMQSRTPMVIVLRESGPCHNSSFCWVSVFGASPAAVQTRMLPVVARMIPPTSGSGRLNPVH